MCPVHVSTISENFLPIAKKFGFNMAYSVPNALKKFKRGKDKINISQCDIVYKITCQDCDASYMGQTKRQLGTRIKEHVSDINKRSGSPSVISNHRLELNHEINWNEIRILEL